MFDKLSSNSGTGDSIVSVPAVLTQQAAACAINLIIYKALHVAGVVVGPPGPWENAIDYVINKYPMLTLPDRFSIANSCSEVSTLPPPGSSEEREHWLEKWRASLPHDLELIETISPLAATLRETLRSQPPELCCLVSSGSDGCRPWGQWTKTSDGSTYYLETGATTGPEGGKCVCFVGSKNAFAAGTAGTGRGEVKGGVVAYCRFTGK
jgi:hypothetical protein